MQLLDHIKQQMFNTEGYLNTGYKYGHVSDPTLNITSEVSNGWYRVATHIIHEGESYIAYFNQQSANAGADLSCLLYRADKIAKIESLSSVTEYKIEFTSCDDAFLAILQNGTKKEVAIKANAVYGYYDRLSHILSSPLLEFVGGIQGRKGWLKITEVNEDMYCQSEVNIGSYKDSKFFNPNIDLFWWAFHS